MGDEVIYPHPFFSRLWLSISLYLCIISHHCHASESIFKENLGIQDILIHYSLQTEKIYSFLHMQQELGCWTIWRHYNNDFISSDLIGQKFLNDWHVGTFILSNQFNVILIIFQMIFVNIKVCKKTFVFHVCSNPDLVLKLFNKFFWELWKSLEIVSLIQHFMIFKQYLWPMMGFKNGASCYLGAHLVF